MAYDFQSISDFKNNQIKLLEDLRQNILHNKIYGKSDAVDDINAQIKEIKISDIK